MRTPRNQLAAGAFAAVLLASPALAQTEPVAPVDPAVQKAHERLPEDQPKGAALSSKNASPAATPANAGSTSGASDEAAMMKQMIELAKPGENHKLLASLVGEWTYTLKLSMDPGAPPIESKGIAVCKPIMGGRYFTTENTGKIPMPSADGKTTQMDFKGIATDGYDNVKQKFVSAWVDNMATGIIISEGTYDAATKTITYRSEYEPTPAVKTKVRETLKFVDADHHVFEFFEDRDGTETKTMEISATRKK